MRGIAAWKASWTYTMVCVVQVVVQGSKEASGLLFEPSQSFEKIVDRTVANRPPDAEDHTVQTIERKAHEPSCVRSVKPVFLLFLVEPNPSFEDLLRKRTNCMPMQRYHQMQSKIESFGNLHMNILSSTCNRCLQPLLWLRIGCCSLKEAYSSFTQR